MEEIWKDIEGFEGLYQVSNMGNVRSLDRVVEYYDSKANKIVKSKNKGRVLKNNLDAGGYCFVILSKKSVKTIKKVHRLVAQAFLENPENKPEVDHINTIKTDNKVDNLKWATSEENRNNPLSVHNRIMYLRQFSRH